jgi:hypothetical protein
MSSGAKARATCDDGLLECLEQVFLGRSVFPASPGTLAWNGTSIRETAVFMPRVEPLHLQPPTSRGRFPTKAGHVDAM